MTSPPLVHQFAHHAFGNDHQDAGTASALSQRGLGKSTVLAMECKVSNDETNSVKRINDILKKSAAWRKKWGDFIRTGAMLQGVIRPSEVRRLLDDDVQVFWSHRLGDFAKWLDDNLQ